MCIRDRYMFALWVNVLFVWCMGFADYDFANSLNSLYNLMSRLFAICSFQTVIGQKSIDFMFALLIFCLFVCPIIVRRNIGTLCGNEMGFG